MQTIRKITTSVRHNERIQAAHNKKLLLPSTTRWLYIVPMLDRFIELRASVDEIIESERNWEEVTNAQWRVLSELLSFLRPVHEFVIRHQVGIGKIDF